MSSPAAKMNSEGNQRESELQSQIRSAYQAREGSSSRMLHKSRMTKGCVHDEAHHPLFGEVIKSMTFGGMDGIITTFAVISGAAGGNLPSSVVVIMGISTVIVDALAMAVGEFLSTKAHNDFVKSEKMREQWEFNNYPEGEIFEVWLVFLLTSR